MPSAMRLITPSGEGKLTACELSTNLGEQPSCFFLLRDRSFLRGLLKNAARGLMLAKFDLGLGQIKLRIDFIE